MLNLSTYVDIDRVYTCQRAKTIGSFLLTRSTAKTWILRKFCQTSSPTRPRKMASHKNEKSEQQNSFFMLLLKMQMFLTQHLGKLLLSLTNFQKMSILKIDCFYLFIGTRKKNVLRFPQRLPSSPTQAFISWGNSCNI